MKKLHWQDIYNAFFDELEDGDYLAQDAILAFPGDSDTTAMITHLHVEGGHLVAHARFDSEPLCYPALSWQELTDQLATARSDAPKAFNSVAAIGFPPDFQEQNYIGGFRVQDEQLVAVATDEATIS
jgi:hypothetical protein